MNSWHAALDTSGIDHNRSTAGTRTVQHAVLGCKYFSMPGAWREMFLLGTWRKRPTVTAGAQSKLDLGVSGAELRAARVICYCPNRSTRRRQFRARGSPWPARIGGSNESWRCKTKQHTNGFSTLFPQMVFLHCFPQALPADERALLNLLLPPLAPAECSQGASGE